MGVIRSERSRAGVPVFLVLFVLGMYVVGGAMLLYRLFQFGGLL